MPKQCLDLDMLLLINSLGETVNLVFLDSVYTQYSRDVNWQQINN